MTKLAKQLRFAHAAEIAAYHAYEGHWRSTSNQAEQAYLKTVQLDELKHIFEIEKMLEIIGWSTDPFLDKCGKIVGEAIGFLCYYTGWRLPMYVAGMMEKIGTASYKDIALEAAEEGKIAMAVKLLEMAKVEQAHEDFFKKVRKNGSHKSPKYLAN